MAESIFIVETEKQQFFRLGKHDTMIQRKRILTVQHVAELDNGDVVLGGSYNNDEFDEVDPYHRFDVTGSFNGSEE